MRLYLSWATLALITAFADLTSPYPQSVQTFAGMLAVVGIAAYVAATWGPRALVYPLLAGSVAMAILATWQMGWGGFLRARGIFPSPNYLGAFAALCFFLAAHGAQNSAPRSPRINRLWLGIALANAGALVLSESRAALLGWAIGLFFAVPRRWRALWLSFPFALPAIYWFHFGAENTLETRLALWRFAIVAFRQRPLTGWGQWPVIHGPIFPAYNIALDWLHMAGVLGVAAFVWAAAETFTAAKGPLRGLIAAYLVNGMLFFDSYASGLPLLAGMIWIASERWNEALVPGRIIEHEPFLNGRMGIERAD